MEYYLDRTQYAKLPQWTTETSLKESKIHKSWRPLFDKLFADDKFEQIETQLTEDATTDMIHPKPDLVFNAFRLTSFKTLKVVIIGQDPYFDHETFNKNIIPQAMGLSFSVPCGIKVPSSLKNMYTNLKKYNHIKSIPNHGNLEQWTEQGCLLLNASLTVKDGTKNKNCHQDIWSWFTDEIIKYISETKEHVVFVLWGSFALNKKDLIDTDKHSIVVSSHPSGLSCNQPLRGYGSFINTDSFGLVNKQLKEWEMEEINWNNEL
jgi:uracil-DNA glycosylase